mgnify:FL=1
MNRRFFSASVLSRATVVFAFGALGALGILGSGPAWADAGADRFVGWSEVSTEHFRFVFEERDQEAVAELIAVAEPIYDRVTDGIPVPDSPIPVVVFGRTDQANGYFTSAPQSHIGIFVAPPTGYWLGLRNDSWLETVFLHELVHFLHLRWNDGFFADLSELFGSAALAPLSGSYRGWAIEGPAVFLETALAPGGRGTNPFFEMYAKALVYEDAFFGLEKAGYGAPAPPRGRIYLAGYLVIDYMVDTYGPAVMVEIQERVVSNPLLGLDHAIAEVTGSTAEEIYAEMLDRLKAYYGDAAEAGIGSGATSGEPAISPAPGDFRRAVASPGVGNYSLPVSAAAGLVTYRTRLDTPPALVVIDPSARQGETVAGETVLLEAALSDPDSFAASQDGETIAFTAYVGRQTDPTGRALDSGLYLYDVDSQGPPRRLGTESGYFHPRFAPDGRVFALQRRGTYRDFVEVDRRTGQSRVLAEADGRLFFHPTISPDGRTAVMVGQSPGAQRLYRVDLRGETRPQDTNDDGGATAVEELPPEMTPYYPRFMPNGNLWFSSDLTGELAVYSLDLDSGSVEQVVTDPVGAYGALYLPGSPSQVLYAAYRADGRRLFVADRTDLGNAHAVANGEPGAGTAVDRRAAGLVNVGPREDAGSFDPVATALQPRTFVDVPLPRLWYPRPDLLLLSEKPADWYPGIGLGLMGWGLFPGSSFAVEGIVYPQIGQLAGNVDLSLGTGAARVFYGLDQSYGASGSRYVQSTNQRLGFNAFLGGGSDYRGYGATRVGFSFGHRYQRSTAGIGAFFENNPADPATESHSLSFGSVLRYSWSTLSSSDQLFPRFLGFVEAGASAALPVSPAGALTVIPRLETSVTIPGFARLHTTRISAEADYAFGPVPTTRTVTPRGFNDLSRPRRGGLLAAVDYSIGFGTMDEPLGQSVGLINAGTTFHFTALADWNTNGIVVNSKVYAGMDLVARLAVSGGRTETGTGFAAEIAIDEVRVTGIAVYAFVGAGSYDNTLVSVVFRW